MTTTEATTPVQLTAAIAGALHQEHFPNAERAALKRMTPGGRAPLAYHRFLMRTVPEALQSPRYEPCWRTLIAGIALQPAHPHDANQSLGQALVHIDFSEDRLERLLASDGSVLHALVLRLTRRLAAHYQKANWNDLARLLFAYNEEARERINTRIARDFYRVSKRTTEVE
mgnify:CR=1 FL=1